jgi:hypothetical protein
MTGGAWPRSWPPHTILGLALGLNVAAIAYSVARGLSRANNPARYFGEGRFTTWLSCLQLALTGVAALGIFLARRRQVSGQGDRSPHVLWGLIATGFFFLAFDERYQIHEDLDQWIHRAFRWRESSWTDRLDDLLVGVYAVIGMGVIWTYRSELHRFRPIGSYLLVGFILTFVSVACDTVSNRRDALAHLLPAGSDPDRWQAWVAVAEGSFMLLAESVFLAGFVKAWRSRRTACNRLSAPTLPPPTA